MEIKVDRVFEVFVGDAVRPELVTRSLPGAVRWAQGRRGVAVRIVPSYEFSSSK